MKHMSGYGEHASGDELQAIVSRWDVCGWNNYRRPRGYQALSAHYGPQF